jgi:hypothetical protein
MSAPEISERALVGLEELRRYVWRNEDDSSRDGILIDNLNDVSEAIWDHIEREPKPTTEPTRSGTDGVGNATTTFTSATGAFTTADEGSVIHIEGRGMFTIVTRNSATSVVLSGTVAAGTDLAWDFGEARVFRYDGSGSLDLRPYDLRELHAIALYTDLDEAEQDALVAADYRLEPAGRSRYGGTYLSFALPTPSIAEYEYGYGWEVTVVGQWGMAAVPGAIKFACKQWVKNIVENPGSYVSVPYGGQTITPDVAVFGVGAGMPRAVERRLDRWKRQEPSGLQVVRFRHPNAGQPGVPYSGLPRAN